MADGKRTRRWAFLVYPDDSRSDGIFKHIETELKLPAVVSPLHDMDVKDDGTPKKPHYHVIVAYSGLKTMQQVLDDFSAFGIDYIEKVGNNVTYTRYLCHLDTPSKFRYSTDDVTVINGYDIEALFNKTTAETRQLRRDILHAVDVWGVTSLPELYHLLTSPTLPTDDDTYYPDGFQFTDDHLDYVMKNSYFFVQFIRCNSEYEDWASNNI